VLTLSVRFSLLDPRVSVVQFATIFFVLFCQWSAIKLVHKMDDLMMVNLMEDLENEEEVDVPLRRTAGDPLRELPERQFVKLFRVSKDLFNFIVTVVEPYMRPQRRPSDLSIHTRVIKPITFFSSALFVLCFKFMC
jgi:hypothetical protein